MASHAIEVQFIWADTNTVKVDLQGYPSHASMTVCLPFHGVELLRSSCITECPVATPAQSGHKWEPCQTIDYPQMNFRQCVTISKQEDSSLHCQQGVVPGM